MWKVSYDYLVLRTPFKLGWCFLISWPNIGAYLTRITEEIGWWLEIGEWWVPLQSSSLFWFGGRDSMFSVLLKQFWKIVCKR